MAKPVLKWAGGKTAILDEISKRLDLIDKENATFFDVFTGGASVAIKFCDLFEKTVINDKNEEIINVYEIIKTKKKELIKELDNHKVNHSHEYYYKVRNIDRSSDYTEIDQVKKAARTIYLNKTCYNGLFRVNSSGQFNVPIGRQSKITIYDKDNMDDLEKILNNFEIYNEDFTVILNMCKPGDVVYFDPPYDKINSSSFTQYNAITFDQFDQRRLVNEIDKLTKKGVYVIASNSFTEYIECIYKRYIKEDSIIMVKRSISSKNSSRLPIKEILIDNINEVKTNAHKNKENR